MEFLNIPYNFTKNTSLGRKNIFKKLMTHKKFLAVVKTNCGLNLTVLTSLQNTPLCMKLRNMKCITTCYKVSMRGQQQGSRRRGCWWRKATVAWNKCHKEWHPITPRAPPANKTEKNICLFKSICCAKAVTYDKVSKQLACHSKGLKKVVLGNCKWQRVLLIQQRSKKFWLNIGGLDEKDPSSFVATLEKYDCFYASSIYNQNPYG